MRRSYSNRFESSQWRWCRVSGFGFIGCLGIWGAGAQSGRVEKLGEAGQGTRMSKSKVEGLRVEGMRVQGGVGGGGCCRVEGLFGQGSAVMGFRV